MLILARGLYYSSYKSPRILVWSIGVIILILMMAIAFLGYVLPTVKWAYEVSLISLKMYNLFLIYLSFIINNFYFFK